MPNPALTQRIKNLPALLDALMTDDSVGNMMNRADTSKRKLEMLSPLDGVEQSAVSAYHKDWLTRYVYNSNAIEGSTLSFADTELVVEGEFVPSDGPARYVFAARGVSDGMAYVERYVKERRPLSIEIIRRLHENTALDIQPVLRGEFRPYGYIARIRGASVKTADPLEIWDDLETLLNAVNDSTAHPIIKAAAFHAMFENIHPFADGNGRTGRQILNMMLMQSGYRPIAIKFDAERSYAIQLEQWQVHDNPIPLIGTIVDCTVREQDSIAGIVSDIRHGHDLSVQQSTLPDPTPTDETGATVDGRFPMAGGAMGI